jgi:FtsH-binding integral membrane protein
LGDWSSGKTQERRAMMKNAYASLALQTVISGIVMYLVMFVMIDSLSSFYNNLNMVYMTLMMLAPMVVLMILAMRHMFPSRAANNALLVGAVLVFVGAFALIRTQTTIGDAAFLRSMIPHHSGAILMCREASIRDPEIRTLCAGIIRSQAQEIDRMKAMLARI